MTVSGYQVGRTVHPLHRVSPQTGAGSLLPPQELREQVGGGDFAAIGSEFVWYYRAIAHLQPTERFLDLGCGIGRMALPLTGYLTSGTYQGLDVWREGVEWCRCPHLFGVPELPIRPCRRAQWPVQPNGRTAIGGCPVPVCRRRVRRGRGFFPLYALVARRDAQLPTRDSPGAAAGRPLPRDVLHRRFRSRPVHRERREHRRVPRLRRLPRQ